MDFGDELPFTAAIPADHWGFMTRRLRYLEAVIIQILGDRSLLKEWYTAGELAELQLPGLPRTRQGIARLANARGWRSQIGLHRGQEARIYHCTVLPHRAFDGLLDRIICRGALRRTETVPPAPPDDAATPRPMAPHKAATENTAPSWVLPLLRIVRETGNPSVAAALDELPRHLPPGVACPTHEEAETVLSKLGMLVGG
ncbi:DNA-binding protein [Azospirillum doebereinerae]